MSQRFWKPRIAAFRIAKDGPVRVPDLMLRSIGFIAEVLGPDDSMESLDPVGTCFLVSIPSKRVRTARFACAVTAKHIFTKGTPNTKTAVIVNKSLGGVGLLPLPFGWIHHPDATVDVAVAPVELDPANDLAAFDIEDLFDASNNPENIGIGDEVFFPGLFAPAPGIKRIVPMVRHGNIAMLPFEQIQTSDGYADIYLIEARSIGGLSGSPVFARETVVVPMSRDEEGQFTGGPKVMMHGLGVFKLLGLIKAHWDVDESKINQAHISHDPKRGVNLGIAQVIPAFRILETLNLPELVEMREESDEAILRERFGVSLD